LLYIYIYIYQIVAPVRIEFVSITPRSRFCRAYPSFFLSAGYVVRFLIEEIPLRKKQQREKEREGKKEDTFLPWKCLRKYIRACVHIYIYIASLRVLSIINPSVVYRESTDRSLIGIKGTADWMKSMLPRRTDSLRRALLPPFPLSSLAFVLAAPPAGNAAGNDSGAFGINARRRRADCVHNAHHAMSEKNEILVNDTERFPIR